VCQFSFGAAGVAIGKYAARCSNGFATFGKFAGSLSAASLGPLTPALPQPHPRRVAVRELDAGLFVVFGRYVFDRDERASVAGAKRLFDQPPDGFRSRRRIFLLRGPFADSLS